MYGTSAAPTTEVRSTIPSAITEINASLSAIAAAEQRLAVAFTRLVNPRPEPVPGNASDKLAPDTVEAKLNDTLRTTQQLAEKLHTLADRFEQAV